MRIIQAALVAFFLSSCGIQGTGDEAAPSENSGSFVPGVLIPDENFEVTDFRCEERIADLVIDGEVTSGRQFWGLGTITNITDERSPNYSIAWVATLDDGTQLGSESGGAVPSTAGVLPLDPGESAEFSFRIASDRTLESTERTVASCDFQVEDSSLNYVFE